MSYLRGVRYNLEKKEVGDLGVYERGTKRPFQGKTSIRIAKETGVSSITIKKDGKFAQALDDMPGKERKEILAGRSKTRKAEFRRSQ